MLKNLSLVMIVKNEESKLKRCLNSVKNIVDEIIIVDTGSTDNTKNIALEFSAKIYDYEWDNNFSNARNYALKKSTGDWNLILDADEYIVDIDLDSVDKIIASSEKFIGQIKRVDAFEQDGEIKYSNCFISRLSPKNIFFSGSIHEQLDINFPRQKVDITLNHDGYLYTDKFDRNISLILNELETAPNDCYLLYQAARTYYVNKSYSIASKYFELFYNNINNTSANFVNDGIILYLYNIIKNKDFEKGLSIINNDFDRLNNYCDFYFACGVFFTELVASNTQKYISYFDNIELGYLNALNIGEKNGNCIVQGTGSYLAAFNLGIFYKLTKNHSKAHEYFELSYNLGYSRAHEYIKNNL